MKSACVIRHVAFEDLGSLSEVLAGRGIDVTYVEAAEGLEGIKGDGGDLLVILGGPIGACQDDAYPFLKQELMLAERRLANGRPILGICLGAQIMARALGAAVYPGERREIGWAPVGLTREGEQSCLRPLGTGVPVLHWHGDTFDLPAGAKLLASTPLTENQAFEVPGGLAVQFHLEVVGTAMEAWYIGHASELAATPGLSVPDLRADASRWSPALATAGRECFQAWLERVGL